MTYDAAGNRLTEPITLVAIPNSLGGDSLADNSHTLTYQYDTGNAAAKNRDVLLSESSALYRGGYTQNNNVWSHNYSYDPAYNPTTFSYWSGSDLSFGLSFNSDNQFSAADFGSSFVYDGEGSPTTYQGFALTFDPEDRLTSISSPAASFTYDGDGLRATKTYNGTTTYYLYDGDKVLLEETYNASTSAMTVTQVYGYAADGLRSRYEVASSLAYDYLYDPQGNVVQRQTYQNAENGEPAVTQAIYDAYGALRSNVLISTDATKGADEVGFGGQYGYYTDPETGLVLCTHRYYDPGAGRWLTRDPISYKGGMNLYSYAGGNPVNNVDPSGYDPREALDEIYKHREDIISIAQMYRIQPQLLAGIVYAEVNAGGVIGYHYARRSASVMKFASIGKGDLGLTKVQQLASKHPELKTFSQRYAWAVNRDKDDHTSLIEAAAVLSNIAKQIYGRKSNVLIPYQMGIVASKYNGEKPNRNSGNLPNKGYLLNKEGKALIEGLGAKPSDDVIDTGLFGDASEVHVMEFELGRPIF
jgi:RHS repeat-associated protein